MDQVATPASENEEVSVRRAFLTRSSVLLAVLSASGIAGAEIASAQGHQLTKAQAEGLKKVIDTTMSNGGNLTEALASFGGSLPPGVVSVLKTMTPEDWAAAARVNSKLVKLSTFLPASNNGYAGM